MNLNWKYVEPFDEDTLISIEKYFKIKLPADYKNLIRKYNAGKPDKYKFDIESRKECVLDYLINVKDIINTSKRIKIVNLLPIATDPFGNIIAYEINDSYKIGNIVFWDHETKSTTFIANNFKVFLDKLY